MSSEEGRVAQIDQPNPSQIRRTLKHINHDNTKPLDPR